jgi:hypothetical protein
MRAAFFCDTFPESAATGRRQPPGPLLHDATCSFHRTLP